MNRKLSTSTLIAAAALTLSATAAYGQEKLTADIPFEFRVNGSTLPAGHYQIGRLSLGSAATVLKVTAVETGKSLAVLASNRIYSVSRGTDRKPHLEFRCVQAGCAIREMWDGDTGIAFNTPKPNASETERHAVVYLTRDTPAGQ